MLGRISATGPVPSTGTQPSPAANTWIRIMPSQKLGRLNPASAAVIAPASTQPPVHSPASTPRPTPSTTPTSRPPAASDSVSPPCSAIMALTGCRVRKLVPKSPTAARPRKRTYCSITGRSSPSRARSASITAWLAGVPASISITGSPGTACSAANTSVHVSSNVGTMPARRRNNHGIMSHAAQHHRLAQPRPPA